MKQWEQAAAVDQLARDLYARRCDYMGSPVEPWPQGVPYHIRSGFFEIALRMLQGLTTTETTAAHDPLFDMASELARAEGRRLTRRFVTGLPRPVIGMIEPDSRD